MNAVASRPPDEATVAAYLGNQLAEAQAEAFEIYCLNHPEFASKVELDLCMKRGLREIGMRDSQARFRHRFRRLGAIAAGLGGALAFGLLFLMWSQWHVGPRVYSSVSEVPLEMRTAAQFEVTLLRLRGSDAAHQVAAPRGSRLLKLRIFPDSAPDQQPYSAVIKFPSIVGSRSVAINQLRPDADGFLALYMPLTDVVGQTLEITLASDTDLTTAPAPAFKLQFVAAAR